MKWVYLRESASVIDFVHFNQYMQLLEYLGQVEHFQEHAMRAQHVLKTIKSPTELLFCPGMTEGYAKKFLTTPLRQAIERVWEYVATDDINRLFMTDPTGIVRDIIAGFEF